MKWQWGKEAPNNEQERVREKKMESRWIINTLHRSHIFTISALYLIELIFTGTVHLISISVTLPVSLSWVVLAL